MVIGREEGHTHRVRRSALRFGAVCAVVPLLLLAGPSSAPASEPVIPPLGASPVLAPLAIGDSTAPAPTPDGISAALSPVLAEGGWESSATVVIDPADGSVLYDAGGSRATAPASTLKVLTALAALTALGPDYRLRTRVMRAGSDIVLVGAGDSTLSRSKSTINGAPTGSLDELAATTARSLKRDKVTTVTLSFDDSLFTGPVLSPTWRPILVEVGAVGPVTALMVDGGRESPDSDTRVSDPSETAARYFAAQLRNFGIEVSESVQRSNTPAGAIEISRALSPTIAEIVEYTLTESDNDVAEALAHLAGGRLGGAASFQGGATATKRVLEGYGVPVDDLKLNDGSGLSRDDRAQPITIARALQAMVTGVRPLGVEQAAPVGWAVLSGLPIAGFTGTLAERFDTKSTAVGRGVVRAKTGTLTGVSGLAGTVVDRDGRLLVFTVLTTGAETDNARNALDRVAATLAGCGCRG